MRFKIAPTLSSKNPVIPINYQYQLGEAIYKVLAISDVG